MGVSTDAILCYGISYEEGYEFPWEKTDGDAEDWYYKTILKWTPSVEIWDEDGDYLNGVRPSSEIISRYYKEWNEFKKNNPMPFEVTRHCSGDYPMYILAVRGTVMTASRGYPRTIYVSDMNAEMYPVDEMLKFLSEHDIEVSDPKWILASYWG
jgi:hypothetical protein